MILQDLRIFEEQERRRTECLKKKIGVEDDDDDDEEGVPSLVSEVMARDIENSDLVSNPLSDKLLPSNEY
jgi:hypothetical protein